MLYIDNPKNHQKTIRMNKFGKGAIYKINIQKSVAFLYASTIRKRN